MTGVTITVSTISDDSYPITILDTDAIAEVKKSVEAADGTPAVEQVLCPRASAAGATAAAVPANRLTVACRCIFSRG